MHYLVTGGTGFIGHALCARLVKEGHRVTVRTRDKDRSFGLLPHAVHLIEDYGELSAEECPDVVVNLAGENLMAGRWTRVRKQAFVDSRVGFTRQLVDWMRGLQRRPAVLISGSAVGYYGARGDEGLTEESLPGPAFESNLCFEWEYEALQAEGLGVRVCRLRTGIVLARDGGALKKMLPVFRLGLGGPIGFGSQWMSWIHREDLVGLILWLAGRSHLAGAFNGTAPRPVRNREFARTLGGVLGRPALLPVPGFALHIGMGEMARLLTTGQKVLPARAMLAGYRFRFPLLRDALEHLLNG